MAELEINSKKIIENIAMMNSLFSDHGIEWSLITKILSGHKATLEKILLTDEIKKVHSIGESRLTNLKQIKEISPDIVTMYIKPPAPELAEDIVANANISLNTSLETIKQLNKAAKKLKKVHRIIVMIELGELREGVVRENVENFFKSVLELSNIRIDGIGTNLGCMYGVEPTYDKLIQLSLYKQILESRFNIKLNLISGGSSITLPLIKQGKIPKSVNHFRLGEAVFLGLTPLTGERFEDLNTDIFTYKSNILEIEEKEYIPDGVLSEGNVGHSSDFDQYEVHDKSYKAILDFGILDVDVNEISAMNDDVSFIGTTSDLTVYDLGKNLNSKREKKYKVGDKLHFHLSYMGVARLMNSKFVEKDLI
jgi:predicted amino acid racemase